MGMLEEVLATLDNRRRVIGRDVKDLFTDTSNAVPMWLNRGAQSLSEAMYDPEKALSFGMMVTLTPTSMVGHLMSLNAISPQEARAILSMPNPSQDTLKAIFSRLMMERAPPSQQQMSLPGMPKAGMLRGPLILNEVPNTTPSLSQVGKQPLLPGLGLYNPGRP